jgi:hypothetical protein
VQLFLASDKSATHLPVLAIEAFIEGFLNTGVQIISLKPMLKGSRCWCALMTHSRTFTPTTY